MEHGSGTWTRWFPFGFPSKTKRVQVKYTKFSGSGLQIPKNVYEHMRYQETCWGNIYIYIYTLEQGHVHTWSATGSALEALKAGV